MNTTVKISLLGLASAACLFFVVDCRLGNSAFYTGTVLGKEYQPPYTTFYTDSNGHLQSTYHDAVYRLFCSTGDDFNPLYVTVNAAIYHSLTIDQPVALRSRKGRWTKFDYLLRVTPLGESNLP